MLQNSTGTVLQYKGMSVIDSRNVATKYDFTISDGSNVESKASLELGLGQVTFQKMPFQQKFKLINRWVFYVIRYWVPNNWTLVS